MIKVPDKLLQRAETTISKFGLIPSGQPTLAALSGGKDSMLLCLALQALGIDYIAITINMGYESGWGDRIRALARSIGISAEIVDVRQTQNALKVEPVLIDIRRRLTILDSLGMKSDAEVTPCTHCYSVKALSLDLAAKRHGIPRVAFAHHMTDAAASLLKEALLHVDRFDYGHETYVRDNFEHLVQRLALEATQDDVDQLPLTNRISQLVTQGRVDTDEPPRQPLRSDLPNEVEIVRPFFEVDEDYILDIVKALEIGTEGSGCGHGLTAASETPREMVHHRVLTGRGNSSFFSHVAELVLCSVDNEGRGRVQARQRRRELLGDAYKATGAQYDKL